MINTLRYSCLWVLLLLVCFFGTAHAQRIEMKLTANQSAIDGGLDITQSISHGTITAGIGGVYYDDTYKIVNLRAVVGNNIFTNGLQGRLGLKGLYGEVEKPHHDGDLLIVGFLVSAAYDLSKGVSDKLPLVLSSSICLSPKPLCFIDSKAYFEFMTEIDWNLLENAAMVFSYRYRETDFENQSDWQKSSNTGYVGFRFVF